MAITGSEIGIQRIPSFAGRRTLLLAAALVVALGAGVLVGRETAPTAPATTTATVSTRWIDDASVRTDVMEAMNGISVEATPVATPIDIEAVRQQVMDHMNQLRIAPAAAGFEFGTSVTTDVMRHMNELLAS